MLNLTLWSFTQSGSYQHSCCCCWLLRLQDGYYGTGGLDADAIRGDSTQCIRCPSGRAFSFPSWDGSNTDFKPFPTSRIGATSPSDCLAEYAQVVEGFFKLSYNMSHPDFKLILGRESLGACMDYCCLQDRCAAFTFDYEAVQCYVWTPSSANDATLAVDGGIALKTMLSLLDALDWGDVSSRAAAAAAAVAAPATGSQQATLNPVALQTTPPAAAAAAAAATVVPSAAAAAALPANRQLQEASKVLQASKVCAKGMGSGYFPFWPGAAAAAALDSSSFINVDSAITLNDCLWACSMINLCAGVVLGAFDAATGNLGQIQSTKTRCQKIMGQSDVSPQRTLLQAKYTALSPVA
jgi:hypothetical protein